jgi:sec-independent protein translocase protein TatA
MLAFISGVSPLGLIVILVIALLVFGSRLPEVARSMGRAMNEFKRGLKDVDDEISSDPPREKPRKLESTDSDTPVDTATRSQEPEPARNSPND